MTDPVLAAWLAVIARDGWAAARIDAVAVAAGTTTAAVAAAAPDRWAALDRFHRALDVAALADAGADRDGSVRDRLFTLLMARFDALHEARAAVVALLHAARRDPGLAAALALATPPAMARVAEAAGVATTGIGGALRVQAMTLLYAAVARVWLTDDSDDLAATMKELDTRLAQAETWARRLPYRLPPEPQPGAPLPAVLTPLAPPALPAAAPRSAAGLPAG